MSSLIVFACQRGASLNDILQHSISFANWSPIGPGCSSHHAKSDNPWGDFYPGYKAYNHQQRGDLMLSGSLMKIGRFLRH